MANKYFTLEEITEQNQRRFRYYIHNRSHTYTYMYNYQPSLSFLGCGIRSTNRIDHYPLATYFNYFIHLHVITKERINYPQAMLFDKSNVKTTINI
ncbi:hypothetical protein ACLIBH_10950 [Virgibacillus sp. W0430]|uniref:hypothetical protein n=1 Tax=Virgibacillus sp. W0430 TaxID=3391580 RepID=UPI003F487E1D